MNTTDVAFLRNISIIHVMPMPQTIVGGPLLSTVCRLWLVTAQLIILDVNYRTRQFVSTAELSNDLFSYGTTDDVGD